MTIAAIVVKWADVTAPVREIYFLKENATATEQQVPYSAHLREVNAVSCFAVYVTWFTFGW